MYLEQHIICSHCQKDTGYTHEQFMYYLMTHDILCPHCREVIFHAPQISFDKNPQMWDDNLWSNITMC